MDILSRLGIRSPKKEQPLPIVINKDAFSDGQISSKLWLIDKLSRCAQTSNFRTDKIHIYGGWYGLLPFMMKVLPQFRDSQFISIDLDANSTQHARLINNAFIVNQSFRSITDDVLEGPLNLETPDVIINTSCEHMCPSWLKKSPSNSIFVLQSTDMVHVQHTHLVSSIEHMKEVYPLKNIFYAGEKYFEYETLRFHRYMIIGTL